MPLRVGVLLDSTTVEGWAARIVRGILADDRYELTLVVFDGERRPRPPFPVRAWRQRHRLAWMLYERLDARIAGRPGDALAPVDLSAELAAVPALTVVAERPRPFEQQFPSADVERVREADLDVIIRLGFGILRGDILHAARAGIWSYHHGDSSRYRGGPSHFWEMRDRDPVTGTVLQVLTENLDAGHVIYRSWMATDPASLHRGRTRAFTKGADFVLRRLADVHRHGPDWLTTLPGYGEPDDYDRGLYRAPGNRVVVGFLSGQVTRWVRRRLRRMLLRDQWSVAVRESPEPDRLPTGRGGGWQVLRPPLSRFYADPFVVDSEGEAALVFEDYSYALGRARISTLPLPLGDTPGEPRTVLDANWHLSYPFVVEDDGRWYLIPESADRRTLELYRAEQLPDRWVHDATLMRDVSVYDATFLRRDGRWWMWATVAEPGATVTDEVSLFSAGALRGPWEEHPDSPVVSDVRRARPAGPLFEHQGRLIRPAQDSSVRYGLAIVLHEVTVLTPERYEEVVVGRIDPGEILPGNRASHTYVRAGRWEVVDVMVPRLRLRR